MLTILAVLAVILTGCERKDSEAESEAQTETSKKTPEFTLKSFGGKEISLSDYKGKIVVLEWFNDECPYVRYHYEKANTMVELANKYRAKNVVWLAINSTNHTTPRQNKDFAARHKYALIRYWTTGQARLGGRYGATNTPHIFIIDTKGNIAYKGAIDNSPLGSTPDGEKPTKYVDKTLAELVSGKNVSSPKTKPYGCSVKYAR